MKQIAGSVINLMMFNYSLAFVTIIILFLLFSTLKQPAFAQIPDDARQKIQEAAPGKSIVIPASKRKLLVFNLCRGYIHNSIPYGDYAIQTIGRKTGAYDTEISNDPAVFNADNLKQYDAVLFNNTTGPLFRDPVLKQNLLDFVNAGKGIIGIHAATDCFYDWPEFGEMMGGYFNGHPWNENVTITPDIPDHPLNAAFNGEAFEIADEIYQFKEPYSRDKLQILLSLDVENTNMTKAGILRKDGDFAVSWIRSYGKGRVFYCSLGHRYEIYWNPQILQHYLDGILFAMGDLPVDTTPSALLGTESQKVTLATEDIFVRAAKYNYGQSRLALSMIAERVRLALVENRETRVDIVAQLLNLLESETSTYAAKDFACRQLAIIGGDESVPVLAGLLSDPELSHMARLALQNIPTLKAGEALCQALSTLEGEELIGVINTLGIKADPLSANSLLLYKTDSNAASAALADALKNVPIPDVIERLSLIINQPGTDQNDETGKAALNSLLICADLLAKNNKSDTAYEVYERVYQRENVQKQVRYAALRGMADTSYLKAIPIIMKHIESDDPFWQNGVAGIIANGMSGQAVTRAIASEYEKLTNTRSKIILINALAERGDFNAGALLIQETENENSDIAISAINALGSVPVPKSVPFLIKIAAKETNADAIRKAARASINRLQKPNRIAVDVKIVSHLINTTNNAERVECLNAVSARNITNRSTNLMDFIYHKVPDVRIAAWHALGNVADVRLWPEIIARLSDVDYNNAEEVSAAYNAVDSIRKRIPDADSAAGPLISALQTANQNSKIIIIRVLANTGSPDALDVVYNIFNKTDNHDLRQLALQTLTNWPDTSVLDLLYNIILISSDTGISNEAFTGYIRITKDTQGLSDESRFDLYQRIQPYISTTKHTTQLLEGLSEVPLFDALEAAETYLTNDAFTDASAIAMIKISRSLGSEYRDHAIATVNRATAAVSPPSEEIEQLAAEAIDYIQRYDDFITKWQYSGPYRESGIGGGALFDRVFPPEQFNNNANTASADNLWVPLPKAAVTQMPVIDFIKFIPASDCCVYLKTLIISEQETPARLEVGSDDGIKVWLNNEVVHTNNVMRGLTIGSDMFTVNLKTGTNVLIMKITQGGGDWRTACRIRSVDGLKLPGITIKEP